MKPTIIDWRITSKCNNNCGFCYATNTLESLSPEETENTINAIISTECQAVCITGGEPLMETERAISIIQKLNKYGVSVYLSTNGSLYKENIDAIEPYISKLSLPLDGFSMESNQINGRNASSFDSSKGILEIYKKKRHSFPIKVGTVLSKKNLDIEHFIKIYELLKQYQIDVWKIYQFIPEASGADNMTQYSVSEEEYQRFIDKFCEFLNTDVGTRSFKIMFSSRRERNSAYFIIQPDGTVIIPIDDFSLICREEILGNLKSESIDSIITKWQKKVININSIGNAEKRNIVRPIHKLHIDSTDRDLLYQFDRHPLYDDEDFSKLVALSNNVIRERIEKLYQIRAIKQVIPIVNVSSFGFDLYLVSLFFSTSDNTSYIADILCHHKNIAWVAECYDWGEENINAIFRIAIFAENNNMASNVINEIGEIFGKTMYKYEIDIVPDKYVCDQRYLLENPVKQGIDSSHITLNHESESRLSKSEYDVLVAIKAIERPTYLRISKYTGISKVRVQSILDGLQKRLVINKYQAVFDSTILGYNCYLLFLKFYSLTSKKELVDYLKKLNQVSHINTLNAGRWDIDVEMKVENPEQFFALWEQIYTKFGSKITASKLIRIVKEHKFEFLIPAIMDVAQRYKKGMLSHFS